MNRIPIDKVQTGMVLATDVKDVSGRMLLTCNTIITDKHLRILRTWGVSAVEINSITDNNSEDSSDDIVLSEDIKQLIEQEIKLRFAYVNSSHPVILALKRIVRNQLSKQPQELLCR